VNDDDDDDDDNGILLLMKWMCIHILFKCLNKMCIKSVVLDESPFPVLCGW